MPHSYTSCLVHLAFSTKERRNTIPADALPKLWEYIGGIARKNGFKVVAAGGTTNHLHVLVPLPGTMPVAKAVQLLKGGSSKWMHETGEGASLFGWQEGYGAFSIGASQVERTVEYIRGQERHHKEKTFEEEFVAFLRRNGVEYDERHVWG